MGRYHLKLVLWLLLEVVIARSIGRACFASIFVA